MDVFQPSLKPHILYQTKFEQLFEPLKERPDP